MFKFSHRARLNSPGFPGTLSSAVTIARSMTCAPTLTIPHYFLTKEKANDI